MPELRGLRESAKGKALPAPLGRGHLCGLAAGWGGAAPLCGRAGLEPAFLQSHALGWEGLGARTQSKAGCLRLSRGVWLFWTEGLQEQALGLQTVPQPFPSSVSSPSLAARGLPGTTGRVGWGRAELCRASPVLRFFPSPQPAPGPRVGGGGERGCFQRPPDLGPLPACPPLGPPRSVGHWRRATGWRSLCLDCFSDTG